MIKKRKFSKEECFFEARKYDSRVRFFKECQWAYSQLQRRSLLDEACAHMPISPVYVPPKWTVKAAFLEAAKYARRSDFKMACSGAHGYLISNRLLDQACFHMRGSGFWHIFELMAVAIKYGNCGEFKRMEPQAYNFAIKNGLTSIVTAHMERACKAWSKESVIAEAKKFASRSDLFFAHPGAYKHATRHGYWDEACSHMEVVKRLMDKEMALSEAKKYQTRAEFQERDGGAYSFARTRGFLDESCAHMEPGDYGFNPEKPATLYLLRVTAPGGQTLYKVGITNRSVERRIAGMGLFEGVTAEVIDQAMYASGRDARIAEKRLHRKASSHKYIGPPVMSNGNTELFTESVFLS